MPHLRLHKFEVKQELANTEQKQRNLYLDNIVMELHFIPLKNST